MWRFPFRLHTCNPQPFKKINNKNKTKEHNKSENSQFANSNLWKHCLFGSFLQSQPCCQVSSSGVTHHGHRQCHRQDCGGRRTAKPRQGRMQIFEGLGVATTGPHLIVQLLWDFWNGRRLCNNKETKRLKCLYIFAGKACELLNGLQVFCELTLSQYELASVEQLSLKLN